ncbi:MAG: cobalamin-dependent protein [Candidatus Coatesbacteria bacterium]|nr:cobalamin-dependent protein [Candidatus Coatesbacteria bacterium]
MRLLFVVIPSKGGEYLTINPGLVSIATYLVKRTRHQARILDFTFCRKKWRERLRQEMFRFGPDVVGVSLLSTHDFSAQEVVGEVRKINPSIKIVGGGYHAAITLRRVFDELDIDAICVGEGEYAAAEYLDRLESGESLEGLKGIWFRDGDAIVENPVRPAIENLADLPAPDWRFWCDFDKHLEAFQMLPFIGQRSCLCGYTHRSGTIVGEKVGAGMRLLDPVVYAGQVREAWDRWRGPYFKIARMWDPVFTINREWMRRFLEEYERLDLVGRLPYSIYSRIDDLDEGKARLLCETGCVNVRTGIESGDALIFSQSSSSSYFQPPQPMLLWRRRHGEVCRSKVHEKDLSDEQIRYTVDLCRRYDLALTAYFCVGGPGETRESLTKTRLLARRMKPETSVFHVWKPLPSTKASDKLREPGGGSGNRWGKEITNIARASFIATPCVGRWTIGWFRTRVLIGAILRKVLSQFWYQKHHFIVNFVRYFALCRSNGFTLFDALKNFTYVNEVDILIEQALDRGTLGALAGEQASDFPYDEESSQETVYH